jgi:hypothetical protein
MRRATSDQLLAAREERIAKGRLSRRKSLFFPV